MTKLFEILGVEYDHDSCRWYVSKAEHQDGSGLFGDSELWDLNCTNPNLANEFVKRGNEDYEFVINTEVN